MATNVVDELIVEIRARTESLEAGLQRTEQALSEVAAEAKKNTSELSKMEKQVEATSKDLDTMGKSSQETTMAMAVLSAAGVAAFAKIVTAVQAGLQAYNETRGAIMGLRSQVEGLGMDFGKTLDAAKDLYKDGLISPADTNASIKNLLNYGFTLEQAESAILRLKDAAAFGRQAQYTLGEAVKVTTEGIRMENSVLSDAAGVQKNIAKMIEDYAKSLGRTAESLSQNERAQAVYNGIMQETQINVGDAAKVSDELSGAQARQAASAQQLAAVYGEALAPAVAAGSGFVASLQDGLREWIENNQMVAAGVTGTTVTIVGLVAAGAGIQTVVELFGKLKIAIEGVKAANAAGKAAEHGGIIALLAGPGGTAVAVAAGVIAAIVGVVSAVEVGKQKQKEAVEANQEAIKTTRQQIGELQGLKTEYESLRGKTQLTGDEKQRLLQIERDLVEVYGASATGMDAQGRMYTNSIPAIQELIDKNKELLDSYNATEAARLATERAERGEKITDADAETEKLIRQRDAMLEYKKAYDAAFDSTGKDMRTAEFDARTAALKALGETSKETADLVEESLGYIKGYYGTALSNASEAVDIFARDAENRLKVLGKVISDQQPDEMADVGQWVNSTIEQLKQAGAAVGPQAQAMGAEIAQALMEGFGSSQAFQDNEQATGLIWTILGSEYFTEIDAAVAKYNELAARVQEGLSTADQQSQLDELAAQIQAGYQYILDNIAHQLEQLGPAAQPALDVIERLRAGMEGAYPDVAKLQEGINYMSGLAGSAKAVEDAKKKLVTATTAETQAYIKSLAQQKQSAQELRDMAHTYQTAKKGSDEYKAAVEGISKEYPQFVDGNNVAVEAILGMADAQDETARVVYDAVQDIIRAKRDEAQADLDALNVKMQTMYISAQASEEQQAKFAARVAEMQGMIAGLKGEIQAFNNVLDTPYGSLPATSGSSTPKRSSGGTKTNKALDDELAALAHKKAMDELTAQAELEWLERIRATRAKTAEERRSMDEKIYSATKQLIMERMADLATLRDQEQLTLDQQIRGLVELAAAYQGHAAIVKSINDELFELRREKQRQALQTQLDMIDQQTQMGHLSTEQQIEQLNRVLEKYAKTEEEKADINQRLFSLQVQLNDERYQNELEAMNRSIQLGDMNLAQQIRYLEIMREKYADNAQRLAEIDQMLFDKRLALQQEAVSQLDRLYEGVVQALTKRYQKEKKAEEDAVRSSIDLRKKQSEAIIKGIQAQIDAMDALDKAEKRGDEDAEYQDKRARLLASKSSEKDTYNQQKIQEQIDKLDADYAEKKKKRERDDQKAALQDAIQTERDKITALSTELQNRLDAINTHYEKELDTVKIRFEAEKVLANSTQQEILDMMATYAPHYDLIGKSYGERMIGALRGEVKGGFDEMLADLNRSLATFAADADRVIREKQAAMAAFLTTPVPGIVGSGSSGATKSSNTTVNQTYNFNVPTANPLDVAAAGKKGAQDILKR